MPPHVFPYPVRRPGFITSATWQGSDSELVLQCVYQDLVGNPQTISFPCKGQDPGELCLPASNNIAVISPNRARDMLVAHLRIACMLKGGAIPGSDEFKKSWVDQLLAANFQVSIGTAKITAVRILSDLMVRLTWQVGSGPSMDVDVGHDELNTYAYAPSTQLLIIPGAVEKKYPTYVHDYPNQVLTQTQRDNIVEFLTNPNPDPEAGDFCPFI